MVVKLDYLLAKGIFKRLHPIEILENFETQQMRAHIVISAITLEIA